MITLGPIPLFWIEFMDAATTLHKWSYVRLNDPLTYFGGEKLPQLTNVGQVRRALSDRNGNYESAAFTWEIEDTDRSMRKLLADPTTRYLAYRPVSLRVISDASRRALGTPTTIAKGVITTYQPGAGLKFAFSAQDTLASRFASTTDQNQVPQRVVTLTDFPNASTEALKMGVPIIYGNVTDRELLTLQSPAGGAYASDIRQVPVTGLTDNGGGGFTSPVWVSVTAVRGANEGRSSPVLAATFVNGIGSSIRVNWNKVVDADSYRIYFANAADFGPFTGSGSATTLRYVTHNNSTLDGVYGTDFSLVLNSFADGSSATPTGTLPRNYGMPPIIDYSINAEAGTLAWQDDNPDPAKRPVWLWLVPVQGGFAGPAIQLNTVPWMMGAPDPDPLTSTGVTVSWNASGGPPDFYRVYFADAEDFDPFGTIGGATKARFADHNTATHDGMYGYDYSLHLTDWGIGTSMLVSTALVDVGKGACPYIYVGQTPLNDGLYHTFLLAGHACQGLDEIYSDGQALGYGYNPAVAGVGGDWVVPGTANWNAHIGTTYQFLDINGRRYYVVFGRAGRPAPDLGAAPFKMRGPHGDDIPAVPAQPTTGGIDNAPHSDVPLGFSVRGIESAGDGTGALIEGIYDQYRHAIINWVLGSYQWGPWLAAPTFVGSTTPQVDTASFDAAYTINAARFEGSYLGAGVIGARGERITVRELLRWFNLSGDCNCGFNRQFQFFISMDDPTATPVASFTESNDIVAGSFTTVDTFDEHLNEVPYLFARDTLGNWAGNGVTTDATSIANYGGTQNQRISPDIEFFLIRDQAAALDIAQHRLARTTNPVRYVTFKTSFDASDLDLGQVVLVTHYEGIGEDGWVDHPIRLVRITLDPEAMLVELTGYDLEYAAEPPGLLVEMEPVWVGGSDSSAQQALGTPAWIPASARSAVQVSLDTDELAYSASTGTPLRRTWLGGSDSSMQQAPAPVWIPASARSAVQVTLDVSAADVGGHSIKARIRADAGTVRARFQNIQLGVTAGISDIVDTQSYTTVTFPVTLSEGNWVYEMQLFPSLADTDVALGSAYLT